MVWIKELINKQLIRYVLVGFVNTLVTACCIIILTYLSIGLYTANLIGYILGIILSYFLNSIFTFSAEISISRSIKFLITCLICYLINLVVIYLSVDLIDNKYFVQLMGMIVYTISSFLINKLWAMK